MATDILSRPLRTALYARVSKNNGCQDPEVQLRELREYAARRGWTITGEYVECICSGKDRRLELEKLKTACRKRPFDAVVVYRYDRFARSLPQLVNALDEFRALGIDFVPLHEGVDTSTPNGRLIFGIFAPSRSLKENSFVTLCDRACSCAVQGKRLGHPKVYLDAGKIAELRLQGRSWSEISTALNPSKGTAPRAFYQQSAA